MSKHTRPHRATPTLESLEGRLALATVYLQSGDLIIEGEGGDDTAYIYDVNPWQYQVIVNGQGRLYSKASEMNGGDVYFNGYAGRDFFSNQTNLRGHATGGAGEDWLFGGSNSDWLDGGDDTDYIWGYGGDDHLWTGQDYDYNELRGGTENDNLYGSYGPDLLVGDAGYDKLYGREGDDTLDGGDDGYADILNGGPGRDWFQQEWAMRSYVLYGSGYWYNRDAPVDYNWWEDYYYN
jgi:Ca2+-binding RTX toxin-like protein